MPRIVFFSGGSALAQTARELARRHIPATYIITTFDSGGSTQALRKVFDMPAIGDLRNRLVAAAGAIAPDSLQLLKRRINRELAPEQAKQELFEILSSQNWNDLYAGDEICEDLQAFLCAMPATFDARNASIGNLALTGAWLRFGHNLTAALERYTRILQITGKVLPVTEASLHLGAELADGRIVIGQHILNKEIHQKIRRIFLTSRSPWTEGDIIEIVPLVNEAAASAIENADLLIYSMGSFYSSIIVNLLPAGIAGAIVRCRGLKIFIPNTGIDSELQGLDIAAQAAVIKNILGLRRAKEALDLVLIDSERGVYPGGTASCKCLEDLGIRLLDVPLIDNRGLHEPEALISWLEKLA